MPILLKTNPWGTNFPEFLEFRSKICENQNPRNFPFRAPLQKSILAKNFF